MFMKRLPVMPPMIRPITEEPGVLEAINWSLILQSTAFLCIAALLAAMIGRSISANHREKKTETVWIFIGITTAITLFLLFRYGASVSALKGILFLLILLYASFCDMWTRECPDFPHLMIAITACIEIELSALPGMILSAGMTFAVMIGAMLIGKSDIMGGDLKLATACAFLLGVQKGLLGLFVGMTLGVIVNLIKQKNRKSGFPLIPYLAVGYMAAYFI